jgi:Na+-translocating ferredoxin:NAD+ oxidoreductase subunit B
VSATAESLAERIDAALPQTQCTRCGYADCRSYADAIAIGEADINQCPPGGAEGIARLAGIVGREVIALNPANGAEGPRRMMFIDEAWCIGCTLCIKACPVECIVGAPKVMHTIIEALCTGCELCLPACPVDCILVEDATPGRSGWQAWSAVDADRARIRYTTRRARAQRNAQDNDARLAAKAQHKLADLAAASNITDPAALERKRATIQAAIERASARARVKTPT